MHQIARILTNSANYRLPGVGTLPPAGSTEGETATPGQSASAEASDEMCACGHLHAQHDAIAARFCVATIAGSLERHCVCARGK